MTYRKISPFVGIRSAISLGFDREVDLINSGDTAEVLAYLYDRDDQPIGTDDLLAVEFTIQQPNGDSEQESGTVGDDGAGLLCYQDTEQTGQYLVSATFTLTSGAKRSTRADFEVIDPFNPPAPSNTEIIGSFVWNKLEDCFDAEDEGPWLRDMTLNYFNERKMTTFIAEGLFEINERQPPTTLVTDYFFLNPGDPTADMPLVTSGTFLAVLRHLMRSYVEQPLPQGANIVYEDRRDYMTRWATIYQIEKEWFDRQLALFKRRFLGLGSSRILVDTKAGRLLPAPLRVRATGRGFY